MTVLFNILAAVLLVVAAALSFRQAGLQTTPAAPEAAIVAAATRAGLVEAGSQPTSADMRLLSFTAHGCPAPLDIVFLPSLTHNLSTARRLAAAHRGPSLVVYDGMPIDGLSFADVFWPWLRRKLAIAVTFAPRDNWSSALILLLMPPHCPTPPIDWATLGRQS